MKLSNLTLYGLVLWLSHINAAMANIEEDFYWICGCVTVLTAEPIPPITVPEPATLAVFGIGMVGALVAARKRNKK